MPVSSIGSSFLIAAIVSRISSHGAVFLKLFYSEIRPPSLLDLSGRERTLPPPFLTLCRDMLAKIRPDQSLHLYG